MDREYVMAIKALIVDDEALARTRMRSLLQDCALPKVEVGGEAANAGQALALLAQHSFDVVLLDIHMPGTDGLALAHQLTGRADAPAVVFVTAHAGHALRAFDLEAIDYVTKPVRLSRLVLALQKVERRLAARRR